MLCDLFISYWRFHNFMVVMLTTQPYVILFGDAKLALTSTRLCRVSPYKYSIFLDKLMEFAGGKIFMALERGYNLNSLVNSAQALVEVLLQHKPIIGSLEAYPFESTWRVIQLLRRLGVHMRGTRGWKICAGAFGIPLSRKSRGKKEDIRQILAT